MRKILLLSALAGTAGFYSCTKEKTVTVTETIHDTITNTVWANHLVNADSLTAGVTVVYGTKVSDSVLPAASTASEAPVLDLLFNRTYTVVQNRFLTIYPANVSGTVAGYYVQIAGASSYFKVDYATAEATRKAVKSARKATNESTRGYGEGYIDSAIVIKLPASIHGDTFYVKYAAYDDQNRVSKPSVATVVVKPQASSATLDSLAGTWKYRSYRYYYYGDNTDEWSVDTGYQYNEAYYKCENNLLVSGTSDDQPVSQRYYSYGNSYNFGNTGAFSYSYYSKYGDLNTTTSSCSNYVYDITSNYSYTEEGFISLDPSSRMLTIIYQDNNSNVDIWYETYGVSELTSSRLVLADYDTDDDSRIYYYEYIKQ